MKRIIIFALLIIVVAGGIYAYREYTRTNEDLKGVKAVASVTATDLIRTFESDSAKANTQYLDKAIAVSDKIKAIERDNNSATVVLGEESSMSSVRCSMDSSYLEEIKSLKVGQQVTIKGVCTGFHQNEIAELGSDVILNRAVLENQ